MACVMATKQIFLNLGIADHADYYALDGVEIKIGEAFKPPRKVRIRNVQTYSSSYF